MGLPRLATASALALALAAAACGEETPIDEQARAYCGSRCDWAARCVLPEGKDPAACLTACLAGRGHAFGRWRTEITASVIACLDGLPCSDLEDRCVAAAMASFLPPTKEDAAANRCRDRRAACRKAAGRDVFADRWCQTLPALRDRYREAALEQCLGRACRSITYCLRFFGALGQ